MVSTQEFTSQGKVLSMAIITKGPLYPCQGLLSLSSAQK